MNSKNSDQKSCLSARSFYKHYQIAKFLVGFFALVHAFFCIAFFIAVILSDSYMVAIAKSLATLIACKDRAERHDLKSRFLLFFLLFFFPLFLGKEKDY